MISVVICTYNRCESLKDTLNSLLIQNCNGSFDYEIVVVDNNSKDKTKQVIEAYKSKFNGCLKYVFEIKQGLSHARNRGIKESKGEIIAFTDDDCICCKDWVYKIFIKFKEDDKLDGILGGAVEDNGRNIYDEQNMLRGNGLNMAFKKYIFETIGTFDVFLGAGSIGDSTEDVEFIYRLLRKNKKITICEEIKVIHKQRESYKKFLKYYYRDSKGYFIFWLKYILKENDILALKNMYRFLLSDFVSFLYAIRSRNKERIRLKVIRLMALVVGLIKGVYIWLFLVPLNSLFRSKFITSN